jgi:N-acetylglutamate synthase
MEVKIGEMQVEDYDDVAALWQRTEGIGLDDDDSREGIATYLVRNPGISQVARAEGRIVAAVLCGHDGRRGYLHHLAVATEYRNKSIGKKLVQACLSRLAYLGIPKCNIFLFDDNDPGRAFWNRAGWNERSDLRVLQHRCGEPAALLTTVR